MQRAALPLTLLAALQFTWELLARFTYLPSLLAAVALVGTSVFVCALVRSLKLPNAGAVLREAGNLVGDPVLFASLERSEHSALGPLVKARAAARAATPDAQRNIPTLAVRLMPLAVLLAVLAQFAPGRCEPLLSAPDATVSVQAALSAAQSALHLTALAPATGADTKPAQLTANAQDIAALEAALRADTRALARLREASKAQDPVSPAQALEAAASALRSGDMTSSEREALRDAAQAARDIASAGSVADLLSRLEAQLHRGDGAGASLTLEALAMLAEPRAAALAAVTELRFVMAATRAEQLNGVAVTLGGTMDPTVHTPSRGISTQRQREPEHTRILERYFR
ncbi:MAG: hypothetical protein EXS14_08440 [Planctomycetes bacterium]|nr:hypothetical protein [Planctomycetota bacterium]